MLKAIENALNSKVVASEQFPQELALMKTQMLNSCLTLNSWGWGSNKKRLVDVKGLAELCVRVARAAAAAAVAGGGGSKGRTQDASSM